MSLRSPSVAGPPAKHHYIPKFYQRGFINDKSNQIWVYEKGRQPRRSAIRKAGMKIALYDSRTAMASLILRLSRENCRGLMIMGQK